MAAAIERTTRQLMTTPVCSGDEVRVLESAFVDALGEPLGAEHAAAAPGRVNLIGEHTDYNDGFVFPIAIDRHVYAAVRGRGDRRVRVVAARLGESCEFALDAIAPDPHQRWSNYVRGVALGLIGQGLELRGVDMAIGGNLPIARGLSSSAALELATAQAFVVAAGSSIELRDEAILCRRAENEFVGVGCGIMDQYICSMGERGKAMLLDCRQLTSEMVPVPEGAVFVVCDTGKPRELKRSAYGERQAQCRAGAAQLGVSSLREATMEQLERSRRSMDEVVWRRCRHVIAETARTQEAAAHLRRGNLDAFGDLMNASHASLRDDYEVSCEELDAMVEAARGAPGCHGARLTGAGFGGCAVALVDLDAVEEFRRHTRAGYVARITEHAPSIYPIQASDGVSVGPAGC